MGHRGRGSSARGARGGSLRTSQRGHGHVGRDGGDLALRGNEAPRVDAAGLLALQGKETPRGDAAEAFRRGRDAAAPRAAAGAGELRRKERSLLLQLLLLLTAT